MATEHDEDPAVGGRDVDADPLLGWLAARLAEGASVDVDALCGERPDLAEDLRRVAADWEYLDGAGEAAWGRADSGAAPSAADPRAGDLLDRLLQRERRASRYEDRGALGRGGMGEVREVFDPEIRRFVAMKILADRRRPGTASRDLDPHVVSRFLEEVRVSGQLDHPGIVPVHDIGLDAEGRVYFTMRLVRGRTLRDVLKDLRAGQGDVTATRVVDVLLRVCEAMAYAHTKGVIHRDLKPDNVMVGPFGEVYVMDWGVARIRGDGRSDADSLRDGAEVEGAASRTDDAPLTLPAGGRTMDGDVIGTPPYMAPEQARGRRDEIGPRTDVYAVGAMLYELLAGRAPYETAAGDRRGSRADVARVLAGPPARLSRVAADAPSELVAVCDKAMSREPADRYPTTMELASDLRAFLEHRVVSAYEAGSFAEARKWAQRNPAAAITGALLVLVGLLAAAVVATRERSHAADMRSERDAAWKAQSAAEAAQEHAAWEREKVLRLADARLLQDLVAELDRLWPPYPETKPALLDWLDRAEALAARADWHRAVLDELRAEGDGTDGAELVLRREWWVHQLSSLVAGLEAFAAADKYGATVVGARRRVDRADFVADIMADFDAAWADATRVIADAEKSPLYRGLVVPRQTGLVPIGPDPRSGLWEFWDVLTGDRPQRGPEGALRVEDAMGIVYVLVPGGDFWMGAQARFECGRNYDPDAGNSESSLIGLPVERSVAPYFLSKYETTQAQWIRVMGTNPSYAKPGALFNDPNVTIGVTHPVERVRLRDAQEAATRIAARLPSEEEWEYAARLWEEGVRYGETRSDIVKYANIADATAIRGGCPRVWEAEEDLDDGYYATSPVGVFAPSAAGFHDMLGNVWEYTSAPYKGKLDDGSSLYQTFLRVNPRPEGCVVRGGALSHGVRETRFTIRRDAGVQDMSSVTGVRFARSIGGG